MEIPKEKEPPSKSQYGRRERSLLQYIPKTKENKFFYENGLSKIIPRLKVRVSSSIEDCYNLWEKFSPNISVFDLWDLRYSWYQGYKYNPYFYTIYEGKKALASLPLWFDDDKKEYQWFGSYYMEDNIFFAKEEKFIDLLFKIIPKPININALDLSNVKKSSKFFSKLEADDSKNIKDISGFKNIEDLLRTLDKKSRYHLKSDYNKILSLNPKVIITDLDKENLFEILVKKNIERFDDCIDPDDKSDFIDQNRKSAFYHMVKNTGKYQVKFVEVFVQNYLAAIDFIVTYKDIYYTFRGANDISRFKGIGNFMVFVEFEDAIKNGYRQVDCLQVDYGWKHRFFNQKDLFKLEEK